MVFKDLSILVLWTKSSARIGRVNEMKKAQIHKRWIFEVFFICSSSTMLHEHESLVDTDCGLSEFSTASL